MTRYIIPGQELEAAATAVGHFVAEFWEELLAGHPDVLAAIQPEVERYRHWQFIEVTEPWGWEE